MIGGVTRHMLPHLSEVPHLHVNRPQIGRFWKFHVVVLQNNGDEMNKKKCAARAKLFFC